MSLRICLSVSLCVTQLCHHHPSTTHTHKKKQKKNASVHVFTHAWWWCLWALVRTHQSEFSICVCCTPLADRWKPQAQRWGSLFWSTLPPASYNPPPSCPPPTPPSFFPLACLRSPSRNKSFNLTVAGPRTWLQAVEAFLCYYEETNLALYLTQ